MPALGILCGRICMACAGDVSHPGELPCRRATFAGLMGEEERLQEPRGAVNVISGGAHRYFAPSPTISFSPILVSDRQLPAVE